MNLRHDPHGSGCGCDRARGSRLIGLEEALALIARNVRPIEKHETLAAAGALGRVLAAPIHAHTDLPRFDSSAMDGYAVRSSVLDGSGPWVLNVPERVTAGAAPAAKVGPGVATRIFTGAPLPEGADAVVMQEEVRRQGDRIVLCRRPVPGVNIRKAGAELTAGQLVLAAGCRIGPRELAAVAAAGHGSVPVRKPLRVALLVTGDEVRQAGDGLGVAQIWDVNTPMLTATLTRSDVALVACETAMDSLSGTQAQFADLAGRADLVVTTGGISVGEEDHVKPALAGLGLQHIFSGVALKPGKPVSMGRLADTWWLGLPGNPLSAFVTWHLFGFPLMHALTGQTHRAPIRRHVRLNSEITHKPGRTELRPARITGTGPDCFDFVTFDPQLDSARIMRLHQADGLIVIPADTTHVPKGALVDFLPFDD